MNCQPCEGMGFVNLAQVPEKLVEEAENSDDFHAVIEKWIALNEDHDVAVCGCCGDGDGWYGEPGSHNDNDYGPGGPYAHNGGLPECS